MGGVPDSGPRREMRRTMKVGWALGPCETGRDFKRAARRKSDGRCPHEISYHCCHFTDELTESQRDFSY